MSTLSVGDLSGRCREVHLEGRARKTSEVRASRIQDQRVHVECLIFADDAKVGGGLVIEDAVKSQCLLFICR